MPQAQTSPAGSRLAETTTLDCGESTTDHVENPCLTYLPHYQSAYSCMRKLGPKGFEACMIAWEFEDAVYQMIPGDTMDEKVLNRAFIEAFGAAFLAPATCAADIAGCASALWGGARSEYDDAGGGVGGVAAAAVQMSGVGELETALDNCLGYLLAVVDARGASVACYESAGTVMGGGSLTMLMGGAFLDVEGSGAARRTDGAADATNGLVDAASMAGRSADEIATAGRLASHPSLSGRTLSGSPHVGADFVDDLGRTYDALGTPAASQYWNQTEFLASIDRHVLKSNNFTVIDLTGFTQQQISVVSQHIGSLSTDAQQAIIRIGF